MWSSEKRDSIYASTAFITNTFSGFTIGGTLTYQLKEALSLYGAYTLFYSRKYYAIQYGEYHSTAIDTQRANIGFGKQGHFYQIGLRYHIGNLRIKPLK